MGASIRSWAAIGGAALCATFIAGCSPTFDWRQNAAAGTGLVTSFPCRPDRHARRVELAGATVRIEMLVCSAGGATYAVSFFDAPDGPGVAAGLARLRAALLANIGAGAARERPLALAGADAAVPPVRLSADGRRPDGAAVRLEAAFFARDRRVYQAAVVGPPLPEEGVEPFFDGLKLPA